jgi:hypothetical protein
VPSNIINKVELTDIFVVETWIVGLNEQRKLSNNVKVIKYKYFL